MIRFLPAASTTVSALILTLAATQASAGTPVIVNVPSLDRSANLLVNGSFEVGHPGPVMGPAGSPSVDSVYWALVAGGPHDPLARGDLSLFPPEVEMTPPGWTGSGGKANYAEWTSQWPAIPGLIGPTGPALSTAPIHGTYSVYFGNYYISTLNVPQNRIEITPGGEWIFQDGMGGRVDPVIVPGQAISFLNIPAASFRPEVTLAQTITDICEGSTFRLSFTVFGEFGHPDWIESVGVLASDGFFGLEISGHDIIYLDIPAGSGLDPSGNPGPFGPVSEHTYIVEFVATGPEVEIKFINWGHFNRRTVLGGQPYLGPPGITQTSELVIDDVIVNQVSGCTCDLAVDKTCRVEPPPPMDFGDCDGKLQQFTVIWNGAGAIDNVSVVNGTGTSATGPVSPGEEVIVTGPFSDNDVVLTFNGGTFGQSVFHVSCSDNDFDGPEDCGKAAGNGKSNSGGLDNTWLLEGFIDKNGQVLDCNPEFNEEFADNCSFDAPPAPSCALLKDAGDDLTSLTLRYTGAGCPGDNDQADDKVSCSGSVDPGLPVTVSIEDDLTVSPTLAMPDQTFTLSGNFSSNTEVALSNGGGTEFIEFHTSCSQPLAVGDSFGSMTVVGINGQDGGADVTYQYQISNHGDDLTGVEVSDDLLGPIGTIPFLGTGDSQTLSVAARIAGTTINVATAAGTLIDGNACVAGDAVTVEAIAPSCLVSAEFYKVEDDKIKFKLTNVSTIIATLETFVLDFPTAYGSIKQIKLDGDIYKRDESPLDVGPGVVVTGADWTQANVAKRQLEPDETRTLEVVFTHKAAIGSWVGMLSGFGSLTFSEGCVVDLPDIPHCEIGKPTALAFEYTGDACGATSNAQEGSLECSGDPMGQAPVAIVMTKDAGQFTVAPNAGIGLNDTFEITRTDELGKEFPSEIRFDIRSGGQPLQSLKIHTSCSKELEVGDQFGGVLLRGFAPAD